LSPADLRYLINTFKKDTDGKMFLLCLFFSISQDKKKQSTWKLVNTFDITLLGSIKKYFKNPSKSNTEDNSDYSKFKTYISRVIFFRFQKWLQDVVCTLSDNNGKVGDIIANNETPDWVYEMVTLQ
jgi:hypothetical protein